MTDLYKLEDVVVNILNHYEVARFDDQWLYSKYVKDILHKVYPDEDEDDINFHFYSVMTDRFYRASHGIAEFGSISRCRRKAQEKYEYLKPSEALIEVKKELQSKYRKYARGERE
jgi:hypothetical protein